MELDARDMFEETLDRWERKVAEAARLECRGEEDRATLHQLETRLKAVEDAGEVARRQAREAKAKLDAALTLFTEDQKAAWERMNAPAGEDGVVF